MKNFIITAIALAGFTTAIAQTTIYTGDGTLSSNRIVTMNAKNLTFKSTTGNFYVNGANGFTGINNTAPTVALDVNGDIKGITGIFTKSAANGQTFATNNDRVNASLVFSAGTIPTGTTTQFRVFSFMDIPQSNIDAAPQQWFQINNRNNYTRLRFISVDNGGAAFDLFDKTQQSNFAVNDDGNNNVNLVMPKANSRVCIGTTSSTDGTDVYSLSVNGNVRADRVKVYTTWADYVFEEGYKLPTLEEVEKHIKEKGHLQDIPSAKEVEAKGIDLGEMNKLLLQKVEELTLYMIEQNKVSAQQTKQIEELKTQIKTLSEKN